MSVLRKYGLGLIIGICLSIGTAWSEQGDQSLFINLSSDQIDRAAMAINFGTRVREQKEIPVTIFLNVSGVRIADNNIPEHQHATGKSLKQMLTTFMASGGQVLVCPMCMQNVGGLESNDLLEGVQIGAADITWPAMFAEGVTVLSY